MTLDPVRPQETATHKAEHYGKAAYLFSNTLYSLHPQEKAMREAEKKAEKERRERERQEAAARGEAEAAAAAAEDEEFSSDGEAE